MIKWKNIIRKLSIENRSLSGIAVIVIAAILMELTFAMQYQSASKGIHNEVQYRAEAELDMKKLEI